MAAWVVVGRTGSSRPASEELRRTPNFVERRPVHEGLRESMSVRSRRTSHDTVSVHLLRARSLRLLHGLLLLMLVVACRVGDEPQEPPRYVRAQLLEAGRPLTAGEIVRLQPSPVRALFVVHGASSDLLPVPAGQAGARADNAAGGAAVRSGVGRRIHAEGRVEKL